MKITNETYCIFPGSIKTSLHIYVMQGTQNVKFAYSPGFVTEVVDGVQRVDRGDASILKTDDQVPEILVLGHAEGVLAHQDEVGPERPGL